MGVEIKLNLKFMSPQKSVGNQWIVQKKKERERKKKPLAELN